MSKCHHFTFGIDLELEYWTFLCDYKCGIGWGWCIIWCPSWPMGARVKPAKNCSDLLFCHIYLAWLPCGQDGQGFPPLLTCSPCESTRPFSSPAFLTFETKCWYSLAKGLHFLLNTPKKYILQIFHLLPFLCSSVLEPDFHLNF